MYGWCPLLHNSLSLSHDWVDSRRACILQAHTHTHVSMYECTFVCKRFCFNFAATAHTHSHTHTATWSAAHLTTLASSSAKHKRHAPPRSTSPRAVSIIWLGLGTTTTTCWCSLQVWATGAEGVEGGRRGAGRRRGMRGSHIITCERHNRCRASDADAMYTHTHIQLYIWYVLRFARRTDPATQRQRQRLNGRVSRLRLQRRESHVFLCSSFVAHFGSTRPQSEPTRQSALELSVGFARYKSSRAKNCAFNRARQLLQWVWGEIELSYLLLPLRDLSLQPQQRFDFDFPTSSLLFSHFAYGTGIGIWEMENGKSAHRDITYICIFHT